MKKPPLNPANTYLQRYKMYCLSNNVKSLKQDDGSEFYALMKKRVENSLDKLCETKRNKFI